MATAMMYCWIEREQHRYDIIFKNHHKVTYIYCQLVSKHNILYYDGCWNLKYKDSGCRGCLLCFLASYSYIK